MRVKSAQAIDAGRPARTKNAQSLVEFALVLTVLMLILLGVFDLGFAIYANNTVALAAREGARVAVIQSHSDAQICAQVIKTAVALNLTCTDVTITPSGSRSHFQPVTVHVTYTYQPISVMIASAIGTTFLTLQSQATMVVE